MSLQLCTLASGSAGNSTVVRTPRGVMLIDAGIGPRTAAGRLECAGLNLGDIGAVCLTHLDRDHFNLNWVATLVSRNIPVFCHQHRVDEITALAGDDAFVPLVQPFDVGAFEPLPGLWFEPIHLAHDERGSHGFVMEGFGCRVGYATDLGHVPRALIERFENLDLLALESNYDPQMQEASPRPRFLKQRIMGGAGHLSNAQAFAAIKSILDRCEARGHALPAHVVLLHRSRQCNCPALLRKFFARDARMARRLVLAEQFEISPWLGPGRRGAGIGPQLMLGFESSS